MDRIKNSLTKKKENVKNILPFGNVTKREIYENSFPYHVYVLSE